MVDTGIRTKVLLADDHAFILAGLKLFLEDQFEVVGTVTDGCSVLSEATRLHPDVIILDMCMPHIDGLEATPLLRRILPEVKIIFLTAQEDPEVATQALKAGASAYLLKSSGPEMLIDVIGGALAGDSPYVTPSVLEAIEVAETRCQDDGVKELTARQREVLLLLARGRTMKQVASTLALTPSAVADHKYRIMNKLKIDNNAELMRYAFEHGIA